MKFLLTFFLLVSLSLRAGAFDYAPTEPYPGWITINKASTPETIQFWYPKWPPAPQVWVLIASEDPNFSSFWYMPMLVYLDGGLRLSETSAAGEKVFVKAIKLF